MFKPVNFLHILHSYHEGKGMWNEIDTLSIMYWYVPNAYWWNNPISWENLKISNPSNIHKVLCLNFRKKCLGSNALGQKCSVTAGPESAIDSSLGFILALIDKLFMHVNGMRWLFMLVLAYIYKRSNCFSTIDYLSTCSWKPGFYTIILVQLSSVCSPIAYTR